MKALDEDFETFDSDSDADERRKRWLDELSSEDDPLDQGIEPTAGEATAGQAITDRTTENISSDGPSNANLTSSSLENNDHDVEPESPNRSVVNQGTQSSTEDQPLDQILAKNRHETNYDSDDSW